MIDEIQVADAPADWESAGFAVDSDGTCRIGAVRIELVGREVGTGILGWSLRAEVDGQLDGVPTTRSDRSKPEPATHPNGVTSIDHVVLLSPDLERTKAALKGIGREPRRERDGELGGAAIRQVFYRFGEVIVEVIGSPDHADDGPSSLWGITFVADDIEAATAFFGSNASPVKDAVQPGRRISTLRHRELGMSVRSALISPHVGS